MSTGKLILVRHGQSEWNASNQFTGWYDVPLTDKGRAEAVRAGEMMVEAGLEPTILYTSLLTPVFYKMWELVCGYYSSLGSTNGLKLRE